MLRQSLVWSARRLTRSFPRAQPSIKAGRGSASVFPRTAYLAVPNRRFLFASSGHRRGILPDTEDPQPKESAETVVPLTATELTDKEYHVLADEYFDAILSKFEELQDTRDDIDVEFSAGVMTLTLGNDHRTYVINKQPPNKQIWLASPTSGPKRYDWVIQGDGQHEKEGTGVGDWIYLRDGSSLSSLLKRELDIHVETPHPHRGE